MMRVSSKGTKHQRKWESLLCVLSDRRETRDQVEGYFRSIDGVEVLVVPHAPLPDAQWSVIPAEKLVDLDRVTPRLTRRTRVIAFGASELLTPAFLFGCWDFMKDPWSPEELYLRLRRDARDSLGDSSRDGELHFNSTMLWSARHAVELRPAEQRLLALLVADADTLVSRDELAAALWRTARGASSRSLDMHISNLRKKIRVVASPGAAPEIHVARGKGYRLVGWGGSDADDE